MYVIRLRPEVRHDNFVLSINPNSVSTMPSLYVGLTGLRIEDRFERHCEGVQSHTGYGEYRLSFWNDVLGEVVSDLTGNRIRSGVMPIVTPISTPTPFAAEKAGRESSALRGPPTRTCNGAVSRKAICFCFSDGSDRPMEKWSLAFRPSHPRYSRLLRLAEGRFSSQRGVRLPNGDRQMTTLIFQQIRPLTE